MGAMRAILVLSALLVLAAPASSAAQPTGAAHAEPSAATDTGEMSGMPGMPDMAEMDSMPATGILGNYPMTRDASGTSWQPDSAAHQMLAVMSDGWMFMGHLMLSGIFDAQSGPRGGDKLFAAGMLMASARRDLQGGDTLEFRAMLSPDPLMGQNGYPLLLQTGETANGITPLVDRQHPHDLFMELSGTYARKLAADDSVFFYAGDPGEPALGPPAFMHRASGMDIPDAPLTHHWLDSTHITFGVLTAGYVHDDWKFEVSQFTGREPDQYRYDFDPVRLDSTSARISWNPDVHWALQVSWGYLKGPEQLSPSINENRYTASAMYVTQIFEDASIATTLAWGLKSLSDGTRLNGVLLESELHPDDAWTLFARGEWEENNELVPGGAIEDVGELSIGAIHDWKVAAHWKFGLGALYAFDRVPAPFPAYGNDPHGTMGFVRVIAD